MLGPAVAAALLPFRFPLACYSRTRKDAAGVESFAGEAELAPFLARSRVLVCLLPATPATRDFVQPAMLFLYVLCITSALALGAQEERLARPARDDRGLRLGAGLAEGGETGIAYSLFLLFPGWLPVTTAVWIAVLALTVVLRSLLAARSLR